MHEKSPILVAQKREKTGSRYTRRIRDAGLLPAVVYGHGETPQPISLDAKDTLTHLKKGEKVFELDIEGTKQYVLLKDLGYGFLGDNIIHADFARVNLDERVNTKAHIKLVGNAVGLQTSHAVLMHPITELQLNCVVTNLPDAIEVDITDLDVGGSITAGQIKLPKETMILLTDPNAVVANIVVHNVAEEDTTDEAGVVAADGTTQPEVIAEKKDEEKGS